MICKSKKDVLKIVKDSNVSFIQFWFTDVLGILKSFAVTPSELEEGLEEGMGFDGSSIEGLVLFQPVERSEVDGEIPHEILSRRMVGIFEVLEHFQSHMGSLLPEDLVDRFGSHHELFEDLFLLFVQKAFIIGDFGGGKLCQPVLNIRDDRITCDLCRSILFRRFLLGFASVIDHSRK